MSPSGRRRRRELRKAAGRRARAGRPRRHREAREVTIDFTDPVVARRWRRRSVAAISIGAVAGITWYTLAPGVASYQIGYTLALPAIVTAIVWIGKRLPRWLDWVLAVALGAGGSVAYVLFDGSQWWLWAQVGLLPFVLLVLVSSTQPSKGDQPPREPWYGGMQDGPWGPP
jgi:peptidoglycan/LPS O-acetylase OafA/YrhL